MRLCVVALDAEGAAVLVRKAGGAPWRAIAQAGAPIAPAAFTLLSTDAEFAPEARTAAGLTTLELDSVDPHERAILALTGVDDSAALADRLVLASEVVEDALARQQTEGSLAQAARELDNAAHHLDRSVDDLTVAARLANIGVWRYDVATKATYWSPVLYEMYGLEESDPVDLELMRGFAHPDESDAILGAVEACLRDHEPFDIEQRQMVDGVERWVRVLGVPLVENGRVTRLRGCIQDLTDEMQTREDMTLLATRDYLTEVANRANFTNMFEAAVKNVDFESTALFLFIIDIDHFKHINDNFGHDVGDHVLREISQILLAAVRGTDVVGRLGGDEFGVFVTGPRGGDVGMAVADRIREMTAERESLRRIGGGVTLSIGYAEAKNQFANFKSTLKNADLALYDAKRAGRNRAVRYRSDLGAEYEQRERVLMDVTDALRRDQFEPHYQLKISLKDGSVAGFEALARWRCPERGLLSPAAFWEALENQRLATQISESILAQAAHGAGKLRRLGLAFGKIAVNVTEKQIADPKFPARLKMLADANGVTCADFGIEITEAVLLARNIDGIQSTMKELCDLGVTLSLDDFGTGYASLTHLRKFPIHVIKIDRSFVTDIETNRDSRIITRAVIHMAHDLQLLTVAEGVETQGAADLLRDMGCDVAQGFYFGRPEPFEKAPIACAERAAG